MRASVGLGTCCGFVSVSVQLQSKGKQSRIGDWTERRKAAIAIHGLGRYCTYYCTYLVATAPLPTSTSTLGAGVEGIETVEDVRGRFF